MFERFTERAREVVIHAQTEARGVGQRQIGTEHLLVGMLSEDQGLAAQALRRAGLSAEQVRKEMLRHIEPAQKRSDGEIPFTPHAKQVLQLAVRESLRLGQMRVGTEHLLLGLTDLREGLAIRILIALDCGPEAVRIALNELMDAPVGQAMVHRVRDSVEIRGRIDDWVQITPSQNLGRLLMVAAARVSDGGRSEIEVADLVLAFTLRPGPASLTGLWLTFDERLAAIERDRAWTAGATEGDHRRVGPSDGARRQLMAAGAGALVRGSSVIELSDLLLALIDDDSSASLFERIGLDRFRIRNSIRRDLALNPEVA